MRTELTLLERREIARKTITTKKVKNNKLQGWGLLLAMTHKEDTYDFFKIPKYQDEVEEYYKNNPIVFDTDKGVLIKKSKQK
jgi:hypothetical protein